MAYCGPQFGVGLRPQLSLETLKPESQAEAGRESNLKGGFPWVLYYLLTLVEKETVDAS